MKQINYYINNKHVTDYWRKLLEIIEYRRVLFGEICEDVWKVF